MEHKLNELIEQVLADAEPIIVVTESGGQVVFLPLDEYESWKETMYLLSSSANSEHLLRSIAEARKGTVQEREVVDTTGFPEKPREIPFAGLFDDPDMVFGECLDEALASRRERAALMTADYLAERAKRGSRDKFLAVLAEVPDVPPEPGDEL